MIRRLLRICDRNRKTTRVVSGEASWCGHQLQGLGEASTSFGWVGGKGFKAQTVAF